MTKLQKLIKTQIIGFDWDDYGLDDVSIAAESSEDWATDLAIAIATAITDRVEVEL